MVTIKSVLPKNRHHEIVSMIREIVLATPSLTPRSETDLLSSLLSNNLAVALDSSQVIGWLLATPYTSTTQELGLAYVLPEFRNRGIFNRMIDELIGHRSVSIAITYDQELYNSIISKWGFRPSSLPEVVIVSRGRFLLNRFKSIKSVGAVIAHTTENKPLYLIKRTEK